MVGVVVLSGNYASYVFGKWASTTALSARLCIGGQGAFASALINSVLKGVWSLDISV